MFVMPAGGIRAWSNFCQGLRGVFENCVQKLRINEACIDLLIELLDDMLGCVLGAPIPCKPLACLNDQVSPQFTGFALFE